MNKIALSCSCQKVKGELTKSPPILSSSLICMCDDCQVFANFLGVEKRVLDKHGGTLVYRTTPNKVKITRGVEYLKCLKMSPKGTLRWYTSCCSTPIANMGGFKMAFIGLVQDFIDFKSMGMASQDLFGPVKEKCFSKCARGKKPKPSYEKFGLFPVVTTLITAGLGAITKSYIPNSFYNEETGRPIVKPQVIDRNLRKDLKEKVWTEINNSRVSF